MIAVEDSHGFAFIQSDQQNRAEIRVFLIQLVCYRSNLRAKIGLDLIGVVAQVFRDFFDGEVTTCQFSPLRPRKYADMIEIRLVHLNLIPFGSRWNLSPKGQMPDKQKRTTLGIFTRIVKVRLIHNRAHSLVALESRVIEIALEKFRDRLIL